jgi:hypothetical protein
MYRTAIALLLAALSSPCAHAAWTDDVQVDTFVSVSFD